MYVTFYSLLPGHTHGHGLQGVPTVPRRRGRRGHQKDKSVDKGELDMEDEDPLEMFHTNSILALGHGGQGRRHVLPQLPGAADEEVGLRLAQVHLLQDGDLLGDEAAPMGSQCECDAVT